MPDVSFLAHGTHAAGPVLFLNVSPAHAVQLPPAPVLPFPHTQPGMSTPATHASGSQPALPGAECVWFGHASHAHAPRPAAKVFAAQSTQC